MKRPAEVETLLTQHAEAVAQPVVPPPTVGDPEAKPRRPRNAQLRVAPFGQRRVRAEHEPGLPHLRDEGLPDRAQLSVGAPAADPFGTPKAAGG